MVTKQKTFAETMAASLRRQIADGAFRPGEKLPSIRELVQTHGYSKNTVVEAFERLVAAGEVEPRRGSGYFVTGVKRTAAIDNEPSTLGRAMDTVWLMREQTNNDPNHLPIGHGIPPREWLKENRIDKFHQQVMRSGLGMMFQYGDRFGYKPLRQLLERKLSIIGIEAHPSQIVLTNGANHAMDLIIRTMIRPGDPVLVDEPGYYPLYGKLQLHGATLIGVPRAADGPDVVELENLFRTSKSKIFFTQSVGQNPTGSDTTPAKAHRILQLVEKYDALIVENDPLADLKPSTLPRIATLDQLNRTIYIGSFTKSVSAGLRVGFIACHRDIAATLADVKMLIQVSSSEYSERTLDVMLRDRQFSRHIARMKEHLEKSTNAAVKLFTDIGAEIFNAPKETLYLWAALPSEPDSMKLAKDMLTKNIALAPGAVFYLNPEQPVGWSRYNVGYVNDPRFLKALNERKL